MEILTYRVSSNPTQRSLSYRYKRSLNPSTKLLEMHNQLLLTGNYSREQQQNIQNIGILFWNTLYLHLLVIMDPYFGVIVHLCEMSNTSLFLYRSPTEYSGESRPTDQLQNTHSTLDSIRQKLGDSILDLGLLMNVQDKEFIKANLHKQRHIFLTFNTAVHMNRKHG